MTVQLTQTDRYTKTLLSTEVLSSLLNAANDIAWCMNPSTHTHTHRQTYHIISEKFNGSVNIAADYDPATLCTRHYDI